jgi:hypothetical protein
MTKQKNNNMKKYSVRYYIGTMWSLVAHSDFYEEAEFESKKSIDAFSKDLAQTGFLDPLKAKEWIMPGAILKVTEIE